MLEESILLSIKKLLGVDRNVGAFDQDILIGINSTFTILHQLGVGAKPFFITGEEETWGDFFGTEETIHLVKNYIFLKVKLLFDPPSTGVLHEAIERQIQEFEWRLNVEVDPKIVKGDEPPFEIDPDRFNSLTPEESSEDDDLEMEERGDSRVRYRKSKWN